AAGNLSGYYSLGQQYGHFIHFLNISSISKCLQLLILLIFLGTQFTRLHFHYKMLDCNQYFHFFGASIFFPFGLMASHVGFKDDKKVRVIPSRTWIMLMLNRKLFYYLLPK
ncbi:hypothetical protein ACJX0J_035364, partial [Zea mays]